MRPLQPHGRGPFLFGLPLRLLLRLWELGLGLAQPLRLCLLGLLGPRLLGPRLLRLHPLLLGPRPFGRSMGLLRLRL